MSFLTLVVCGRGPPVVPPEELVQRLERRHLLRVLPGPGHGGGAGRAHCGGSRGLDIGRGRRGGDLFGFLLLLHQFGGLLLRLPPFSLTLLLLLLLLSVLLLLPALPLVLRVVQPPQQERVSRGVLMPPTRFGRRRRGAVKKRKVRK